ncbi:MAG: hypothetical protein WB611_07055 [Stellaceae bacterium]
MWFGRGDLLAFYAIAVGLLPRQHRIKLSLQLGGPHPLLPRLHTRGFEFAGVAGSAQAKRVIGFGKLARSFARSATLQVKFFS